MSRKGSPGKKSVQERFMEKVRVDELTGCWNSTGKTVDPAFHIKTGLKKTLHVASWYLRYGVLPEGQLENVCKNRRCMNPEHMILLSSREERFWRFVDKRGDDECWNWIAHKDVRGYGIFNHPSTTKAHRVSWIYANGEIPNGLLVCHKCDNPSCVNPNHMFLGTYKDNNVDKVQKGRQKGARGARNYGAILNEKQVKAIRFLYDSGRFTTYELSDVFQVSRNAISKIVNKKTWKFI